MAFACDCGHVSNIVNESFAAVEREEPICGRISGQALVKIGLLDEPGFW